MALDLMNAILGIDLPELAPLQGAAILGWRDPGLKPRAESCAPLWGKKRCRSPVLRLALIRLRAALWTRHIHEPNLSVLPLAELLG